MDFVVAAVLAFLAGVTLVSSTRHRFPTYYMEQRCGTTISGHESARVEISTALLYKRNLDCRVTIQVPNGVDIFLIFKRFSLEKPIRGQCVDYLDMYKGPTSAQVRVNKEPLCGERLPWTMNVEASNLMLHFVSDQTADDMGFEIIYAASRTCLDRTEIATNNDYPRLFEGLKNDTSLQCVAAGDICFDKSLICDRVQHCQNGQDEKNCTVPAPQPDKTIPLIAGSTVGGTAGALLLAFLAYMLYKYIQEKRIKRRCEQIKLDDTYPITRLYREPTYFGSNDSQCEQSYFGARARQCELTNFGSKEPKREQTDSKERKARPRRGTRKLVGPEIGDLPPEEKSIGATSDLTRSREPGDGATGGATDDKA